MIRGCAVAEIVMMVSILEYADSSEQNITKTLATHSKEVTKYLVTTSLTNG